MATLPNMVPRSAAPAPSAGAGRVQGILSRLVHYSRESSFCIARIQSDDGLEGDVTVKGSFPEPDAGVCYEFLGDWVQDPKYGRQLKVKSVSVIRPSTLRGIERYLSSGPFPHLGPARARALVAQWGLQTLDILDSPEATARLAAEVSGITTARAEPIVTEWKEHRGRADHLMQLYKYGLSPWQVGRLVGRYGDRAGQVLTQDPYQVIGEIPRFGFLTVDSIAERMGIARDDLRRARAAVLYILEQASDEGHTYLPEAGAHGLFTPERAKEVRLSVDRLEAGAQSLSQSSSYLVHHEESGRYALQSLWTAEGDAAQSLRDLARDDDRRDAPLFASVPGVDDAGGEAQVLQPAGVESLTPEQADAVRLVQLHRLVVVTGGPGVGKTHSLKAMLDVWHRSGQHVELAAPTGKAAQRMAELTSEPARTIHRLLEWGPDGWGRTKLFPVEADVVVIDETSMVDVELAAALLSAIDPRKTRLVLIGDVDQLPSVGPGQVLGDIIASGICPVVRLTKIMRQEAGSAIIQAAHAVNRGAWEPPAGEGQGDDGANALCDLYWVERPDDVEPAVLARELVRYVTTDLPGSGFDPVREVQVLCPQKRGPLGTESLNVELQRLLNGPDATKGEVLVGPRKPKTARQTVPGKKSKAGAAGGSDAAGAGLGASRTLRLGDKVIQTSNNYNLNVFNGEIGFVVAADAGDDGATPGAQRRAPSVQVDFGGEGSDGLPRVLTYRDDSLHGLALAYALTIHKSQGSEFPVVVMPIHSTNWLMLRRRLLYTGLTRARELALLLGTRRALDRAVKCNEEAERCTRLAELLGAGGGGAG